MNLRRMRQAVGQDPDTTSVIVVRDHLTGKTEVKWHGKRLDKPQCEAILRDVIANMGQGEF